MTEKVDVFFTPTYAKVCSNKQGVVISLYLSNASRTNVEIKSEKSKITGKLTLQVKARAKTEESTSSNQFVGLDDPALLDILAYCEQETLLTAADFALLGL